MKKEVDESRKLTKMNEIDDKASNNGRMVVENEAIWKLETTKELILDKKPPRVCVFEIVDFYFDETFEDQEELFTVMKDYEEYCINDYLKEEVDTKLEDRHYGLVKSQMLRRTFFKKVKKKLIDKKNRNSIDNSRYNYYVQVRNKKKKRQRKQWKFKSKMLKS